MWLRNNKQEYIDFDAPENEKLWETIASYMDDEIREEVHAEAAPCSNRYFLESYLEKDSNFEYLLAEEFDIEWW